jgi:hypothetical protein
MGISIHYRGKLSETKKAKAIYQDLTDIARQMNWPLVSLEDDKSATLYETQLTGIALTVHPKCETFFLCFDKDGKLCHPISMMLISEGHIKPEEASVFVKTQFAEPETHLWIIGVLKYLQMHYIPDLQVTDEAGYWETGDVEILEENMGSIDVKSEMMSRVLASINVGDIYDCTPEKMASWFECLVIYHDENRR